MNLHIYKGKLKTSDITERQTGQKLWRWYKGEVWETLFHIIKTCEKPQKRKVVVNKQVLKNSSERRWGDNKQPSTQRQRWHRMKVTSWFLCDHHAHSQERRNSELTEIIPEPFLRITATITPTCHGSKSHGKAGQVRDISMNFHELTSILFNLTKGLSQVSLNSDMPADG